MTVFEFEARQLVKDDVFTINQGRTWFTVEHIKKRRGTANVTVLATTGEVVNLPYKALVIVK